MTRIDEQLERIQRTAAATGNNWLEEYWIQETQYPPSDMQWCAAWPPGGLQQRELTMEDGNDKNVGQGTIWAHCVSDFSTTKWLDYTAFNKTV